MIYICIPAHNEEQTVGVVLWKIRQVMADFPRDYQLLVVDDASTDKTPEVLAPYARVLPLTVVRTETRQGEGAALEMMLREAVRRSEYPKRDVIVTLQADFTQEPDEVVQLIKRTEAGADIVVGESRPDPGAHWSVRWARRLALRVLGRKRTPEGIRDPFTSYRAYRVLAVKRALEERGGRLVHWSGWAGAAELLLATAPHARRIEPIEIVERRERLQRPTRLAPWPSLRAVWSLAREAKPLQVATPAELDEAMRSIAAVRTSEVDAAREGGRTSPRVQRTEGRRGTSEERNRRSRREAQPEGRRRNGAEASTEGRRPRRDRPERERRPREERAARRRDEPRKPRNEVTTAPPTAAELVEAQLPLESLLEGAGVIPPVPAEGARKKRKRPRRRKRGGNGDAATGENEAQVAPEPADAEPGEGPVDAGGPEAQAEATEGDEGAQRARRRRRGRRGGRRRGGAKEGGGAEESAAPEATAGPVDPVPALTEGERSNDA